MTWVALLSEVHLRGYQRLINGYPVTPERSGDRVPRCGAYIQELFFMSGHKSLPKWLVSMGGHCACCNVISHGVEQKVKH